MQGNSPDVGPDRSEDADIERLTRWLSLAVLILVLLIHALLIPEVLRVLPTPPSPQGDGHTVWDTNPPTVYVSLPEHHLATARAIVAVALFLVAVLGLTKELLLRGSWVAFVINLCHLTCCVVVVELGVEVLFSPFVWLSG